MAKQQTKKTGKKAKEKPGIVERTIRSPLRRVRRWIVRGVLGVVVLMLLWIALYGVIKIPTTPFMMSESRRLGGVDHEWVDVDDVAPVMLRSVVAAEDANFCNHWGFDMNAIRDALDEGGQRGASTISQQVVKNAFLWHGRSWLRKALEALMTPVVEAMWNKRRVLEVYLNVAEFDEGVFGVEAASRHYFGIGPEELTATQAARLAAVLPDPKDRSASRPTGFVTRRANSIRDGAATILADGRAACFED